MEEEVAGDEDVVFDPSPIHIPAREKPRLSLTEVVVAAVEKRNAHKVVQVLTKRAPLTRYKHIKRIRSPGQKDELHIVVCTTEPERGGGWPEDLPSPSNGHQGSGSDRDPWLCLPSDLVPSLKPLVTRAFLAHVPSGSPEDRQQWEEWNVVWPICFRIPPGKVATRSAEIVLSTEEKTEMLEHVRTAWRLARDNCRGAPPGPGSSREDCAMVRNAAVIVDPKKNEVMGVGRDETSSLSWAGNQGRSGDLEARNPNPLRHAAMVAIEDVAATVRRWNTRNKKRRIAGAGEGPSQGKEMSGQGSPGGEDEDEDEEAEAEPYLCTGYDCYLWQEPCTMCAMALVHSRIRRIIFCVRDDRWGALGGSYRMHSLASLNHHYQVFAWPAREG